MKKIYSLFIFLSIQFVFGQEDYNKYRPVEPLYDKGGIDKFYEYLTNTIDFSKIQDEKDVIIGFVLDEKGKMNHIKVSFCNTIESEKEIVSVLQKANNWDLSNQINKALFICYKIKLIFTESKVNGLKKTMWFREDIPDIKIKKNEFSELKEDLNDDESKIFNTAGVEFKPEYPGGINEFYKYLSKNFKTPKSKEFISGKVIVKFTIEKDGAVNDIEVLRDPGFGTAEEAIRVMKKCINWKPAEQDGKKVRCSFLIPIIIQSK